MRIRYFAVVSMALCLAACGSSDEDDSRSGQGFNAMAERAASELREELATGNLRVGGGVGGLPAAEITPQGDLLIAGKAVALDPAQRKLVLDYRGQRVAVANAGTEIGIQGVAIAGNALMGALHGAVGGDTAAAEKNVDAQAESVRETARQLCAMLPGLHAAEQALEAAVPEFAPYTGLTEVDIDGCTQEIDEP